MRISDSLLQSRNLQGIQNQDENRRRAFEKLQSNQNITTPSDDPFGAAKLVNLGNEMSQNEQFSSTRQEMNNQLKLQESVLSNATDAMQDARTRLVQGLNGTLNDKDRSVLAQSLRGDYETLVSVANTRDGSGNYIFSGYKSDKPPFNIDEASLTIKPDSEGKQYQGGERISYQIDHSRSVTGTQTADNIFRSGSGDNLFEVMKNAINMLETPTENGGASVDSIHAALSSDLKKLDTGMDTLSAVRAEGGTRMNEIEALDTRWGDNRVNLQDTINRLGTIDYTKAASDLTYRQTGYEAAAKAFSMLDKTSLMDYLR